MHIFLNHTQYSYESKRYELHLCPSDYTHFYDLEHRVEELKREHEQHQSYDVQRQSNRDTCLALKDRVFANDCLKFESLHSSQLQGDFSRLAYDEELIGKYVQVVGHLQIAEIGICFLSFHILEPAIHPAQGWDN